MALLDKVLQGLMGLPGVVLVASAAGVYTVAICIYRLYFHPLAKFPGPFWARVSSVPAYLQTQKRDRHIWLWTLQQEYGPIFRFTPNSLLVNTTTGYRQIFNIKANVGKSDYYRAYPRSVDAVTTWNSTDKAVHARKRRVLNTCFSDKALKNAEPFVHANVDRWCELLDGEIVKNAGSSDEAWSGALNMADWANNLVFDILGDLCFGRSFDMKEEGSQLRHVPELMTTFLGILHPIAFSPFTSLWVWLKPRGLDYLLAATAPPALADWATFVSTCFEDRAKMEEDLKASSKSDSIARKDFFHYLFRAVDPDTGAPGYGMAELFGESESLIIAGSDTTAIATAASMFYLARNPKIQRRVADELHQAFGSVEDIKGGTKLQGECKYLQAFIKETLRMSPPVPADLPREVLENGMAVEGQWLPAGTVVSTCCYGMHLDEGLYDKPFEFRPERWLVGEMGSTTESVARAESGHMPFSGGPRSCPGKTLAYLEMSVILGRVLYQFEVRPDVRSMKTGAGDPQGPPGRRSSEQYQLGDIFVGSRDGPELQFKRREYA